MRVVEGLGLRVSWSRVCWMAQVFGVFRNIFLCSDSGGKKP